jgi:hypothetical protein
VEIDARPNFEIHTTLYNAMPETLAQDIRETGGKNDPPLLPKRRITDNTKDNKKIQLYRILSSHSTTTWWK